MNGAIVISWGVSVRGREAKSLEVFGQALAHFDALAKAGQIHGHQEYLSRTGKQRGFMLVTGEYDELVKVQASDEVLDLTTAGASICEDFEVTLYSGGSEQALTDNIQRYVKVNTELGFIPA